MEDEERDEIKSNCWFHTYVEDAGTRSTLRKLAAVATHREPLAACGLAPSLGSLHMCRHCRSLRLLYAAAMLVGSRGSERKQHI